MKEWGCSKLTGSRSSLPLKRAHLTGGLLLMLIFHSASAAPVGLENPTSFFTNVASRLLRSQLNLDLHNIQVYPTNQYTASVHRLLQVAANIYDCATNRTYGVPGATNGFPTIFRPLFRRVQNGTNSLIIIADYREVTGTGMAGPSTAPALIELNSANFTAVPVSGMPFRFSDLLEPMVSGIPLIVGAKKGYPGFNEFEMQTCFNVSRALEFRRAVQNGPVVSTNQMYVVAVSNVFGLEAWNSYSNSYARNLTLIAAVKMTAVMSNEFGNIVLSNRFAPGVTTNITAGTWPGWVFTNFTSSFVLPWGSGAGFMFLTNSSYINAPPWFIPQTDIFGVSNADNFYTPHWYLTLNSGLFFILVDTDANRIIDYVNLQHADPPIDTQNLLVQGASCLVGDLANPAEQWCTNRLDGSADPHVPTVGIANQIAVGLEGTSDWMNFQLDPQVGADAVLALESFRYNLLGLLTPGHVLYRSNVFHAPFIPYRSTYINRSWQANDPLVHYTIDDLSDLSLATNRITSIPINPPLSNLGFVNRCYSPWGGNPFESPDALPFQTAVKDPMITRSDDWTFPYNQGLNPACLGSVHRGTPWQTLFLKSTNILQTPGTGPGWVSWAKWTGNAVVRPDWNRSGSLIPDALVTAPTNDWSVVSLLTALFNTNDLHALASVNHTSTAGWASLLDGITVLTNTSAGQFDSALMTANSPQAGEIAAGIIAVREREPNHLFLTIGDILATPELSNASPWLNPTNGYLSDAALEIIPSQLLPRLRPDSLGSIVLADGLPQVQFTGIDDHTYALEESSDLVNWSSVSTNFPSNGSFNLTPMLATNSGPTFYRSSLIQ